MSRRPRRLMQPAAAPTAAPDAPAERLRLDQWLWRARFYKTRALAAAAVAGGKLRVNGDRVAKPGYGVKLGDALTFARGGRVRVVEIRAFGDRRGPAVEARALYADLTDPPEETPASDAPTPRDELDAKGGLA